MMEDSDDSIAGNEVDHEESSNATSDDEDDDDDEEEDWPDWRPMEKWCHQLRRNTVVSIEDLEIGDDSFTFQLAGCLMKNTSLKALDIIVWENVTNLGAQALARAIENSAIESLSITTVEMCYDGISYISADRWNMMWIIGQSALGVASELNLNIHCGDVAALKLGQAFSCSKNRKLKKLALICAVTTQEGVRALIKGVRKAGVTILELQLASKEVYRILSAERILRLPSISRLEISVFKSMFYNSCLHNLHKQRSSQLQCLSLGLEPADCLNDDDIKQLAAEMTENKKLRQLNLDGHTITDEGVKDLVESWKKWPLLECLNLSNNRVGAAGLSHLVRISSLHPSFKMMSLWCNPSIGQESLSSLEPDLIDGLNACRLQRLCLKACDLSDKDIGVVCKGLRNNSSVKSLNLEGNKIGDEGIASLVECLNTGCSLEELCLSSNPISAVGSQLVLKASSAHVCQLKTLEMINCNRISYQGLAMIAEELSTSKLSRLSIQVDSNGDKVMDIDNTSDKARREGCKMSSRALVDAVKANMHLQYLSLSLIDIPQRAKNEIQFFLDLEQSGRQLLRLDDGLNPFGLWCHVLAKCRSNTSVVYYLLGEQPALIPSSMGQEGCGLKTTTSSATSRKRKLAQ